MATVVENALLGSGSQHAASARPARKPDAADCFIAHWVTESTRPKPFQPVSKAAFSARPLRPLKNWKPILVVTLMILAPSKNFVIKSASFVTPGIFRIVASLRWNIP